MRPLPAPRVSTEGLSAEVVGFEVYSARPFDEIGRFPGMKVALVVQSSEDVLYGFVPERSVIRSVVDDLGKVLFDEPGPPDVAGEAQGFSATWVEAERRRLGVELRLVAPETGAREVVLDADLAVLVGGEPELAETPRVRFVESEAFVLGGVAFEVAHVSRTAGDSPTTRLVLRATDEGVAKAVLDTLEVVTDTGPVTIVRRSWSTMTAPARETTLSLWLDGEVDEAAFRCKLPRDLQVAVLPFQIRVGIGGVVQPPLGDGYSD